MPVASTYNLVNCTPHEITIITKAGEQISIPPSGYQIRAATITEEVGELETEYGFIPVSVSSLGGITILKDGKEVGIEEASEFFREVDGVIVPLVLKDYIDDIRILLQKPYLDVFAPNTAQAIRDEAGRIKGVPNLIRLSP